MSAIIIPNPDNVPGGVTTGYQLQNTVLYASMTGMSNLAINKDDKTIIQGSVFELNGNIVRATENEPITGFLPLNNFTHVYAKPENNGTVNFEFNTTAPEWSTTKGGWYLNDNQKAIIKVITGSQNKIVGASLMSNEVNNLVPPNEGGNSVKVISVKTHETIHLDIGWYRYLLTSGAGSGAGGKGANAPNSGNGAAGVGGVAGVPLTKNTISGVFFHNGGSLIIHVGGNGYNGTAGTAGQMGNQDSNNGMYQQGGGGSGGGGSGAGEESYVISSGQKFHTATIPAGIGGDGGTGNGNDNTLGSVGTVNGKGGVGGKGSNGVAGGVGGENGILRPYGDTNAGAAQIWQLS